VSWQDGAVRTIDQRHLPHTVRIMRLETVDELIEAITGLAVRGAPALGIAGAYGVALAAHRETDPDRVRADAQRIAAARPTAVNLSWGVERALRRLPEGPAAVLAEADALLAEDERTNRAAAGLAADILLRECGERPLRIMTHCNSGRLAAGAWGSGLGAVRTLAERGFVESVLATETRPLLQGARLTVWELRELGIRHQLCADSAGPALISRGVVDCVVVGADRIAANGDVANKIGTYSLALAASRQGIPFVVVAPESTVDETLASGAGIVIEERAADEIISINGVAVAPPDTEVRNPAFDVTPAELITAIVTERRDLRSAD
jgi:S-methyl-5-thioribose-1-phosphate isomerase